MYDDFGCITQLPAGYRKKLESWGIRCCVFEPFIPVMSARLNNRDHRKLLVIDGKVGFTGGINLADEYINRKLRFASLEGQRNYASGRCGVVHDGDVPVLWDYVAGSGDTITHYLPPEPETAGRGFVQPYTDNPLDDEPVGGSVYQNLINRANHSVYIMTPYLILDYAMNEALCNAAKTGIDVRIITPHIPDKWYVQYAVPRPL